MIPLLWVDLETTGLNERKGLVLEIAACATDHNLDVLSKFHTVIHYPSDAYDLVCMEPIVLKMHTNNGLLDEVEKSTVELEWARSDFAGWMFSQFTLGEKRPLAGSNPNFDRRWMEMNFPDAMSFLHYRSFDMNTLHYFFGTKKDRSRKQTHRAMDDIEYDLSVLRKYAHVADIFKEKTP